MIDQQVERPTESAPARTGRRRSLVSGFRRAIPFGAGIVAALAAVALFSLLEPGPRPMTQADIQSGVAQVLASMTPPPPTSQLVYDAIQPSLVLIQVDRAGPAASVGPGGAAAPGSSATPAPATPAPSTVPGTSPKPGPSSSAAPAPDASGLGSGVVIDAQGDILTSLHVVDGASAIQVTFADGTKAAAQITSTEPANDIAVLQAGALPPSVTPATLGNPRSVQIGSDAYVVGNPFGLYGSISAGVVSGLNRTLRVESTGRVLSGLIQVDAAVNPGNSGGPLLNRDGQVVGIVAALLNPTQEDVFVGIGLAVPIDVAGGAAGLPPY